jgi:hypothetical protein
MMIPNIYTLKIRETRDYLKFLSLVEFFANQHAIEVMERQRFLP